ncbi:MAG: O-antigen ligase family protein [Clostridiales bacterium]|nr:O-antigen ligase family protein [Clostridiales bacterium]
MRDFIPKLPERTMKILTMAFLTAMLGIFPLYLQNYYLNTTEAKRTFFVTAAGLILICGLAAGVPALLLRRKNGVRAARRWTATDGFAVLFAATVVISCLMSEEMAEAFWGTDGRRLGGFVFLLCVGVYFVVSRFYHANVIPTAAFLWACFFMWIVVTLQFWGVDVFELYANMSQSQRDTFMGMLGNINTVAGFSGVAVILLMSLFFIGKNRVLRIFCYVASILGIYACIAARSDSFLLSVGSGMAVLLAFAMKDLERLRDFAKLVLAWILGCAAMKLTDVGMAALGQNELWIRSLRKHDTIYMLLDSRLLLAETLILVLFCLLINSRYVSFLHKYGRKILLAAVLAVAVAAFVMIWPLEDEFGTYRGFIWKRTVRNFLEMPLWQKLFGYGPNCYYNAMKLEYRQEMHTIVGQKYIDAHNEFLTLLTVTGIFGAVSYMGMQISLLVSCVRAAGKNKVAILGCAGIVAYLMQGMVNNLQIHVTPMFFILMGIVANQAGLCYEGNDFSKKYVHNEERLND